MCWIRGCGVAGVTDVTVSVSWGLRKGQKSILKAQGSEKIIFEGRKKIKLARICLPVFNILLNMRFWFVILGCFFFLLSTFCGVTGKQLESSPFHKWLFLLCKLELGENLFSAFHGNL